MTEEEKREFFQMTLAAMDQKFAEFNMMNQDRMPQNRTQENMNLRVDVAEFSGQSLTPEDYLKWEARLESFFEFKETTEGQQYKLAKSKLTKLAALWLERVQGQRRRENKGKINTWAKLKKHLRMKYVPLSDRQLPNLTPLPPRRTMTTPTKQVLTKRDYYEDQTQLQAKVMKTIEDASVDLELIKSMTVDDTEINKLHLQNPSTYCDMNDFCFMEDKETIYVHKKKEIQNRKESVQVLTTEISEDQAEQQTKALNSLKDEALNTELNKIIHIDDVELSNLHLQASSSCCELNGFYFIEDEITNFSYDCRYHTNIKQSTERLLQTQEEFRHEELQEEPLTWKHVNLLSNHEVSTASTVDNTRNHEGNAELRTILFKEGGIDAIMKSSQFNIKLGHNCIMILLKPIEPSCTKLNERADHGLNKGDHLQIGLNIYMQAWQDQWETKGSLPIAFNQNRMLFPSQQATEQQRHQTAWQTTLRALERLSWCVFEHEIPRNGISRHGRLHQDLEASQRILTEATRLAPRSLARLTFDNG